MNFMVKDEESGIDYCEWAIGTLINTVQNINVCCLEIHHAYNKTTIFFFQVTNHKVSTYKRFIDWVPENI